MGVLAIKTWGCFCIIHGGVYIQQHGDVFTAKEDI